MDEENSVYKIIDEAYNPVQHPVQHYDDDGNAYDVLDLALSLGLGVQLSDDLDKDSNALGINVSIALEAA